MTDRRYAVAFDGSPGSHAALRWALTSAALDGSAVEAISAWSLPVTGVSPWTPVLPVDPTVVGREYEERLRSEIDAAVAAVPGSPDVRLRVLVGLAGPTLVEAAGDRSCLVVGRRGHGGFAGLLLGSVADYCLHHATVPLVLVPPEPVAAEGDVVVGIDASAYACTALRWAADEAARRERPLVALYAWTWLDQPGDFDPGFDKDAALEYARGIVVGALGERPVVVEVVNDFPAPALLDRSAKGDLVVVGSRGEGALRQALLGSVSRQLAHHAAGPVVVIRPPQRS